MTDSPLPSWGPQGITRPWIVCETGDRWLKGVRRFAPQMMPPPLIPAVIAAERANVRDILGRLHLLPARQPSSIGPAGVVVLWEVQRRSLAIACDYLAQTSTAANVAPTPRVLQLVAGWELSDRERIVLSEFGCAATIRHLEDLSGLAHLIRGYFAKSSQVLD